MWEENNIGGYTQNNEEPTGPLESLSNLNQQAGQALLNLGGQALQKYDEIEQDVLPMRRPAIQGTADWVDNNLTSLLKRFKLTEPYAEKAGDIAGVTTDVGLEIFSPGLEETAAATLTAGAALSPLPVIDEGLGALATGGLYGKNVFKRAAKELPNYQRILNGVFDGSWKRVDGERVFVTPEGVRIDANNIDLNPNIMQSKGSGGYYNRADMATQRLNMQVRMAGSGMGFKDNIFNFDEYLKVRSSHTEADRRWFSGIFSTPVDYNTYRKGFATSASETAYLKRLKADFMKTYPPEFLKAHKLKPGDIQAHHIDALMASLPLYDGVEYLSKEWYDITGTLLAKNVHAGNQARNLKYLVGRRGWPGTPHGITHKYLDEIVGPDGQKLFTADVRARMKTDPAFRIEMTNKWADITLQSNQIADQAAGVFNAINADLLNLQPKDIDQIMSSLGKLQANGLVKPEFIKGRWQIGAEEMRELLFDIDFTQNIGQHFLLADPQGLRALRTALQSKDPVSSYQAIRATLPKQLSLFSDNKVKSLSKKTSRISKNQQKYFNDPDVTKPQ